MPTRRAAPVRAARGLVTLRAEDLASLCASAEPRGSTGTASRSRTDVRLEVCAARAPFVSCGRCSAILCARRQPVSKIGRGPAARVGIVAMGVEGHCTAAGASRGAARASDTALIQVRHAPHAPQAPRTLAASRWSPRAARARPYALASSRPARHSRLTRRPCLAPAETAGPLPAGVVRCRRAPRTSGCPSLRVPERAAAKRATAERATAKRSPDGRTDRPALWRARRA